MKPRDTAPGHTVDLIVIAPRKKAAVRIDHHGVYAPANRRVRESKRWRVIRIQGTVLGQTRQTLPRDATKIGEGSARQHLAVALDNERFYTALRAGSGIETGIHRTIQVQPRDSMTGNAVHRGEVARDDDPSVGIHGTRSDDIIRAAAGARHRVVVSDRDDGVAVASKDRAGGRISQDDNEGFIAFHERIIQQLD